MTTQTDECDQNMLAIMPITQTQTDASQPLNKQNWINSILETKDQHENQKRMKLVPLLLKVHLNLHQHFKPKVVSIGPYHHDPADQKLQQMEILKPLVAKEYFKGKNLQDVFNTFEAEMEKNRVMDYYEKTYSEEVEENGAKYIRKRTVVGSKEEFIRMMFLDGCFVLHFIERSHEEERKHHKKFVHDEMHTCKALLQEDMFLMENQVPFIVLDVLMSQFGDTEKQKKLRHIQKFIQHSTGASNPPPKLSITKSSDLLRVQLGEDASPNPPFHLLELLRAQLIGKQVKKGPTSSQVHDKPRHETKHFVRGAQEISRIGIRVVPSEISTLNQIDFKAYCLWSNLTLPPMTVDDSTERKLLNLIAYEMCLGPEEETYVTSYVCFIDSLIDSAEDVKALRLAGVLNNFLTSDQEVADMFNKIAHDLVPDLVYAHIQANIQDHYRVTWTTWVAEVMNEHFATPWTVVAFLGAFLAILLTLVQTYFQVFPPSESTSSSSPSPPRKQPPPSRKLSLLKRKLLP